MMITLLLLLLVQLNNCLKEGLDQQIRKYIMKDYQRTAMPVDSPNNVTVQLSLSIQGLESVDRINQQITIKVVLRYKWNDPRLRWDPDQFGGLMNITTNMEYPSSSIWYPDINIWELNGKLCIDGLDMSLIHIYHDGSIYWSRIGDINILHKFNLKSFPFSTQNIILQLSSWIHPQHQIDLIPWITQKGKYRTAFDIEANNLYEHLEYDLILKGYKKRVLRLINGNYTYIDFNLQIQKKSRVILQIVIIPSFMIQGLGLMMFFIAPNSPLRIVFSSTILLTMIMFQLMISNFIPNSSDECMIQDLIFEFMVIQFGVVVYTVLQRLYLQKYERIQQLDHGVIHKQRSQVDKKFIRVCKEIFAKGQSNKDKDKDKDEVRKRLENEAIGNLEIWKQKYGQEYC